jgi:mannose-1-phosphate guanylyltransferase/mannose-6-phosphate isomerase
VLGDGEILLEDTRRSLVYSDQYRLANSGQSPALLIEVQSGSYLGEDDIVRFDDIYRRSSTD